MLLLRKQTQPILDSFGLNMLHTEVIDKVLVIVGECGQPLVAISGIKFSKSSLSKDERDFATDLFEEFMVKHSKKLIDFVTQKKAFMAKPGPTKVRGIESSSTWSHTTNSYTTRSFTYKKQKITMNEKDNTVIDRCELHIEYKTAKEFKTNLTKAQDDMDVLKNYVTDYTIYKKEEQAIQALSAEIASCSI